MADSTTILDIILKYSVDRASLAQTDAASAHVISLLDKTRRQTLSVEQAAAQFNAELAAIARNRAVDQIAQDFLEAERNGAALSDELEIIARRLSEIGASEDEIRNVARNVGSAGRGTSTRRGGLLDTADSGLTAAAQLLPGGAGDVARTTADLAQLFSVVGPLGVVAAGAAVGVDQLNRQLEGSKTLLENALDAGDRYYNAILSFTTDAALQEFGDQEARLYYLRQQRDEVQGAIDAAWAQGVEDLTDPLTRIATAFGVFPIGQLETQLKELNGEINRTEQYTTRLAQGINEGAFAYQDGIQAAADAALAEAELAKERERALSVTISAALETERLTAEERQARVESIDREIAILSRYAAQSADVQRQIEDLTTTKIILTEVTRSLADELAEEAERQEALATQAGNYFDALEREGEIREKIADTIAKTNAANADYIARLEELEIEEGERRAEAIAEAADERLELEQDTADRLLEIQRKQTIDETRARGERDALTAYFAREDALEAARKEQSERDKRLRRLETDLGKEFQQVERYYDKRELEAQQRLDREIATMQQTNARLQGDLINAQNAQLQIAQYGSNGLLQIEQNFWNQRAAIANSAMNYAAYNAVNTPPSYITPNYVTMTAQQARQYLGLDSYVDRRFDTRMGDYLQYNNRGR